ncbi:mga helix-turn-helix domain-containing protein [Listeria floridensis FSL S10-1187]|uniref:Mga helix-turn-helix domain-containing protein n=1 Tax=Listeria floridensis FSL S10-1187 TaxID=1265817 RepID=A0ABP3B1Q2_9LIST|nr:helix-turn-helix domain-containing protein [Listeria floridensis]EUJ33814.1 mga helix-turn-helix domain-containing protein [Listeria floridensis FSL S10-1187]
MRLDLDILDTNVELEWSILNLLRKEDRWFSTEELARRLNKTSSLILKAIASLRDNLEEFNSNQMMLHISKGKGVYLEIKCSDIDIGLFLIFLISNTSTYKLFYSIVTENFVSAKKFAFENFLSETTVRRHINKLKEAIAPYELTLNRSTAILTGKETQVRLFLNAAFWRLFAGKVWPFSNIDEHHLQIITKKIAADAALELNDVQERQIMYFLAIGTIRRRNNHYITPDESWQELLDENHSFHTFKEQIKAHTPITRRFPGEMAFLFFITIIQSETTQITPLLLSNFRHNRSKNTTLYEATELFMNRFEDKFVPVPRRQKRQFMLTAFSEHLFAHLSHNFSTSISGNEFAPYTRHQLPVLKEMLHQFIDELYQETGNPIFLKKSFLAPRYSLLLSLVAPLHTFEKRIKVRLETDLSAIANKSVMNQVKEYFTNDYNIAFIDSESNENPDVILTNIPSQTSIDAKIVSIHRILAPRDFKLIQNTLDQITSAKQDEQKLHKSS